MVVVVVVEVVVVVIVVVVVVVIVVVVVAVAPQSSVQYLRIRPPEGKIRGKCNLKNHYSVLKSKFLKRKYCT
jgi:hypothetical protein